MKKYRLRKWYPSLPFEWKLYKSEVILKFDGRKYIGDIHYLNKNEVENNPEFWEEVVEKDYEILDVEYEDKKHSLKGKILSIKRLSDNEVFTVGDNIYLESHPTHKGKIESFEVYENKLQVWYDGFDWLKNIQHVKEPILTTEDGVDIYKGDRYWIIDLDYADGTIPQYLYADGKQLATNFKRFSTKEKAEEWIENNKPRYSKNDIEDALDRSDFYHPRSNSVIDRTKFWESLDDSC